jgi:hypothetical protein
MSAWNDFVKKIYWENKKKNKNYQFKDALKEASKRKGEMGTKGNKTMMKSKKGCKCPTKGGTRKRRGTRKR